MIGDDDTDDVDAAVGVPEVDEEARDEDAMGLDDDDATIAAAPDAAREERTVLMTLAVVGTQYQEHGRENSWRVVDRSMVVSRDTDNERDERAIAVGYLDAETGEIKTVGFIPRKWARKIALRMDADEARVVSATLDARWRVRVTFACHSEAAFDALARVREAVTRSSIRGRGAARRVAIAEANHGLKKTDEFWEGARLGASLYKHVPIPANRASFQVAHSFTLADDYVSTRIGRFEVHEIAEDRRARVRVNDETRHQMFQAIARVGDGRASEETNSKLISFTTRKRPLQGELRVYKCRAYPTKKQAAILRHFAKVQTFDAYNAAVSKISEDATLTKTKNLTALRKLVADGIAKDVPVDIRDAGVVAAVNAYRGNVRKQNTARDEGRASHAFQLHPRRLSTTKVVRCTFRE
ncbi:MAG: HIRAN domain-containing protein, partial [Ilumatobacteraceae bacterium]